MIHIVSIGRGGSALCGHSAEQVWEAMWAQLCFILGWDWPVLGVVGLITLNMPDLTSALQAAVSAGMLLLGGSDVL